MTKTNRTGMVVVAVAAAVLMALTLVSMATGHLYFVTKAMAFVMPVLAFVELDVLQAAVTFLFSSSPFSISHLPSKFLSLKGPSAAAERRKYRRAAGPCGILHLQSHGSIMNKL